MRRRKDGTDYMLENWAAYRRELLGLQAPVGMIGALRCTLAARRDLHHGSRTNRVVQSFPEVYPPELHPVNRAVRAASPTLQEIADWHYCLKDAPAKIKAERMGLEPAAYWNRVARLKEHVDRYLVSETEDRLAAIDERFGNLIYGR